MESLEARGRSVSQEGVPRFDAGEQASLFGIMCELLGCRAEWASQTEAVLVRGLRWHSQRFDSADLWPRRLASSAPDVAASTPALFGDRSLSGIGVVLGHQPTEIPHSFTHACFRVWEPGC